MALKAKTINPLDGLRRLAEKEIFQFVLNEPFYTVETLIRLGMTSKIPNLIKLDKKVTNLKIMNLGGMPILSFKLKRKVD